MAWEHDTMLSGWRCFCDACLISLNLVLRFGTVFESKVALANKRLGIGVFNGFIGEPFGKRPTLRISCKTNFVSYISFKTSFVGNISFKTNFAWNIFFKTNFVWNISFKTNFVWNISFKTNCVWNISFKVVQISPRASNLQRWASTTGYWRNREAFRILGTGSWSSLSHNSSWKKKNLFTNMLNWNSGIRGIIATATRWTPSTLTLPIALGLATKNVHLVQVASEFLSSFNFIIGKAAS